ncbi:MAG: energy transducer TonB [Saprospiraceae bacterium]|nr:energy transducer TonB [Saprospiraceae bacterium]
MATYKDDKLHGELTVYHPNGQLKRQDLYEDGVFISGNCYTASGLDTTHYDYVVLPQYPGGETALMKFISSQLKYPNKARRKGISGEVVVMFTIDKDGVVKNPKIERSVHPLLDKEGLRIINLLGTWKPGIIDENYTSFIFHLPINFRLD